MHSRRICLASSALVAALLLPRAAQAQVLDTLPGYGSSHNRAALINAHLDN
jgi:hypothetical protein